MAWQGVYGHDEVVELFRRALARRRLGGSLLLVGPAGVGKRTFAEKLAQTLLCSQNPPEAMNPCQSCPACRQVAAGTHPDLLVVAKPEEKSDIPLALLIGEGETRMRAGLVYNLGLRSYMGGWKIGLIDDADFLNEEGANCLLKLLEEPPPRALLILIGTSPAKQLPTIRSRCQIVRFRPLPTELVATILLERGLVPEAAQANRLAQLAQGSVRRALELAEEESWQFRNTLWEQLSQPSIDSLGLTSAIDEFVKQAGKEAPPRRARLRNVVAFAAEFYRHVLLCRCAEIEPDDPQLAQHVRQAAAAGPDTEQIAHCIDRCLLAAEQIDRNAHQETLIAAWIDEMARSWNSVTAG